MQRRWIDKRELSPPQLGYGQGARRGERLRTGPLIGLGPPAMWLVGQARTLAPRTSHPGTRPANFKLCRRKTVIRLDAWQHDTEAASRALADGGAVARRSRSATAIAVAAVMPFKGATASIWRRPFHGHRHGLAQERNISCKAPPTIVQPAASWWFPSSFSAMRVPLSGMASPRRSYATNSQGAKFRCVGRIGEDPAL
jgi:hypothetical protein